MKFSEFKLLNYVSEEEQNLRSNFKKLESSLNVFSQLDNLYKLPLDSAVISETDGVIPGLYLMVHFKFYFSISCLLRGHISEGFGSARAAIDASLIAYKIILEPETKESYLKGEWSFKSIKNHLSKEREKDKSRYPLAVALIELHEMCSEHASHADFSVLKHRIKVLKQENTEKRLLTPKYFDGPSDEVLYHGIIIDFLKAFHAMLVIFQPFIVKTFSIESDKWVNEIIKIGEVLNEEQRKLIEYLKTLK